MNVFASLENTQQTQSIITCYHSVLENSVVIV